MSEGTSKERQRTVQESSSSFKEESQRPDDLPSLLSNFRQILLKKYANNDEIDSNIFQYITSIKTKIEELNNLTDPIQVFDILQATLKTYINDLLSIKQCLNILTNEIFQEIFLSLINVELTLDLFSTFQSNSKYARTVFYRSFQMLSLPVITDFLNEKYPSELFIHVAYVFRVIIHRIQTTVEYIAFKQNDLQNQVPSLRLIVEYLDKHKQKLDQPDMKITIDGILNVIWALVDNTTLVPNLIETNIATYAVKWISMEDLSMDIQLPCIHILHNLARHEKGVKALNSVDSINILKEFKKRILDPNKTNNDELYVELRLLYCMVLSLLAEPKENREDLDSRKKVLDRLLQLVVDAGQSDTNKYGGFHISEPIVVLTKLFVHDEILNYILNESIVNNMKAKTKIEFFCQLLMKFRGALASEDDLDQLTLTALFNMIWSISFHDQYIDELKSNSKFLLTVKSLANDDGEAWVDQYVPKHMSSVPKAASGILWNLDEDNPARLARTTAAATTTTATTTGQETNKTNNRMRVMVSYSHADQEFCHKLVDALQKDNHFEVWVDFAYCHTEDFWEEIGEAIEKSNVVLFLMSKDYQDSKSCRQEVMYAKDSLKKRFIPIYMKHDFVATGWLGVRIVGPQYIRFGKKSFEETIKELTKIIRDDKTQQEPDKNKDKKPTPTPTPVIEDKPIEKPTTPTKPTKEKSEVIESDLKPSNKPIEKWTKKDIDQWFDENQIHQDLIDLYDFHHGTEVLLYGHCLRPDWQNEYADMRERYQQKYGTPLYRDQFVRFVGAVNRLHPSQIKSSSCIIV